MCGAQLNEWLILCNTIDELKVRIMSRFTIVSFCTLVIFNNDNVLSGWDCIYGTLCRRNKHLIRYALPLGYKESQHSEPLCARTTMYAFKRFSLLNFFFRALNGFQSLFKGSTRTSSNKCWAITYSKNSEYSNSFYGSSPNTRSKSHVR